MTNETVNLRIESLLLEGVSERDGRRIGTELRSELTRLLNAGNVLKDRAEKMSDMNASITITPGMTPEAIGKSIASAVGGEILSPQLSPQRHNKYGAQQ